MTNSLVDADALEDDDFTPEGIDFNPWDENAYETGLYDPDGLTEVTAMNQLIAAAGGIEIEEFSNKPSETICQPNPREVEFDPNSLLTLSDDGVYSEATASAQANPPALIPASDQAHVKASNIEVGPFIERVRSKRYTLDPSHRINPRNKTPAIASSSAGSSSKVKYVKGVAPEDQPYTSAMNKLKSSRTITGRLGRSTAKDEAEAEGSKLDKGTPPKKNLDISEPPVLPCQLSKGKGKAID
ncbi:hypothetical protein RUND412_005209 [Rhizina undulata]